MDHLGTKQREVPPTSQLRLYPFNSCWMPWASGSARNLSTACRAGTAGGAPSVSGGQADFQRPSSEGMLAVLVE